MRRAPSYTGLTPASARASDAARGASRKRDTRAELQLRRALWKLGLRYRVDVRALPGRPDVVFVRERVAIFCDGDFWHGRNLDARLRRLSRGHNAPYWVAKIEANVARDERNNAILAADGWEVVRVWESDVLRDPVAIAREVAARVLARREG